MSFESRAGLSLLGLNALIFEVVVKGVGLKVERRLDSRSVLVCGCGNDFRGPEPHSNVHFPLLEWALRIRDFDRERADLLTSMIGHPIVFDVS